MIRLRLGVAQFLLRPFSILLLLLAGSFGLFAQGPVPQITQPIDDGQLVTLQGNIPRQATTANDRGATASSLAMNRMMLLLKRSPEREAALKTQIDALHDPKSAQFHRWLTPTQFGEQYGPAPEDIAQVTAWLQYHGFSVSAVSKGRSVIEFSGDAAAVQSAFHTTMHAYAVSGKTHYANATAPQIPQALAGVVAGVVSLNSFEKHGNAIVLGTASLPSGAAPVKENLKFTANTTRPNFSNTIKNAVGPGDLWTIYNETPLIKAATPTDGTGQTIAIVARSSIAAVDFSGFRKNFLPTPYSASSPLNQILNGPDPGLNGDQLENTLDVEYSTAMAPAATIDLVVSGSTNSTDGVDLSAQYIVDNNLAPVVSTSYGLCEALLGATENAFYNSLWQQAAAQGITSMVSAGDNGSAGCDLVGPSGDDLTPYVADVGLQVSGLASTPYNVAVGGTQFTDDSSTYWGTNASTPAPFTSAKSFIPEMVWNESCSPLVCGNAGANIAAGSGGVSSCLNGTFDSAGNLTCTGAYARPSWQTNVYGLPNDNKRHLPDISLNAANHDGYMVCFQGSCNSNSFYIVGGTSAASPSFAGVMSLVNQATGARQGQANYTLYQLASKAYGTPAAPNTAALTSCDAKNGNTSGSACIFHDTTVGTNAVPCDGGTPNCSAKTAGTFGVLTDYAATPGYDTATGIGSMNIANLVAAWSATTLAPSTTSVSFGASTSTFGAPLGLKVQVAAASGTTVPTGTVALLTDSTVTSAIGAGSVVLTNGAYNGNISSLPGGTYKVLGRYSGDGTFATSSSTQTQLTVNPAASSASIALAASDPVTGGTVTQSVYPYGSIVTGNVTLMGVAGQLAPSGTVVINGNGKPLSTLTTSLDGTVSYSLAGLGVGSYSWNVSYAGNNNYSATVSPAISFSVGQAGTVSRIVAGTGFLVGASSTTTVTVYVQADSFLANPTGTVALAVNGQTIATTTASAYKDPGSGVSGAKAVFTVSASQLAAGKNTLSASYAGDGNYLASTSPAIFLGYSATVPVNTITLAASSTTLAAQAPVKLTATVKTGGIDASGGTVNFYDGTTLLGSSEVVGSAPAAKQTTGQATLTLQLAPGSHSITATYLGTAAAPSKVTAAAVSIGVSGTLPTSISLTAATSAANNANYDLTGTVLARGFAVPTSTVDFNETSVIQNLGQATMTAATAKQTLGSIWVSGAGDPLASPSDSVLGDFNGDGLLDLATANASFSDGTISILLGKGDGTFGAPTLYKSPIFTDDIQTADINNDGLLDLVVTGNYGANFTLGPLYIFLGNGDGTFKSPLTVAQTGYSTVTAVSDFNRDGILDTATLSYYPMQITVAFGIGDGTFQAPTIYKLAVKNFSPYRVIAADVNNDGAPDLVEVNNNDNTTQVLLNNGDGTFATATPLATHSAQYVVAGDVNGDGKLDLVVSDYGNQGVNVLLGNGDGTFAAAKYLQITGYPSSLALADMDHDGKLDLVAGLFYPATNTVAVFPGNGDGTFGAGQYYSTGQGHGYGITVGDLNGDGTPDVVNSDINSSDSRTQNIATLLNLNMASATLSNAAVAGPRSVVEQVRAVYNGDSNYSGSVSPLINVQGSGGKATPVLLWQPAPVWGAGVPLGSAVLNATVQGQIAGTFTYTATPATGAAFAITPATTLPLGTYTLTATFVPIDTTDYTTATATRSLTIVAADFNLQTSVQTLTIAAGSSGMFTVTVPPLYGFTGSIALSATGLPGGFTFSANPASVTAGGSSTITIGTAKLSAANQMPDRPGYAPLAGGTVLACVAGLCIVRRRRWAGTALAALLLTLAGVWMSGCGGITFQTASVALVSATPKAASGSPVQLTANITSKNSLKGTVTFYNGSSTLGAPVAVSNGSATLTTSTLPVGLNALTAVYSGDSDNSGATSGVTQQLITGSTSVQITGTSGTVSHSTTVTVILN